MTAPARTSANATTFALVVGTGLQLLMVLAGHYLPAVAALFAPIGVTISLAAGLLATFLARPDGRLRAAGRGAFVGAACALLGVLVSLALGDVPAFIVVVATISSGIGGMCGGVVGSAFGRDPVDAAAPYA